MSAICYRVFSVSWFDTVIGGSCVCSPLLSNTCSKSHGSYIYPSIGNKCPSADYPILLRNPLSVTPRSSVSWPTVWRNQQSTSSPFAHLSRHKHLHTVLIIPVLQDLCVCCALDDGIRRANWPWMHKSSNLFLAPWSEKSCSSTSCLDGLRGYSDN